MQFGIAIRIVAFVSFCLGIILLCVCGWTYSKFVAGEIGQNSTVAALQGQAQKESAQKANGNAGPNSSKVQKGKTSDASTSDILTTYTRLQKEWKEFKPFLMGSGGVAIACGVIQVLTALLLLCSGTKGARDRVGCFKMTHFIIAVGLIAALIVPATFDMSHDSWSQKLRVLFHQAKQELHTFVTEEGFNPDVVTAYYSIIAADVAGILIVIFSTCCLMRNAEYDYREYP